MKNRSNIYTFCSLAMILIFMGIVIIRQKGIMKTQPVTMDFFAMDTVCSITIYDMPDFSDNRANEVLNEARSECERLEDLLSATKETSDIYRINHSISYEADPSSSDNTVSDDPLSDHSMSYIPINCSPETMEVMDKALEYCELSEGRFDVTIGAVSSLWDFHEDGDHTLPDKKKLSEALETVDYHNIMINCQSDTGTDTDTDIGTNASDTGTDKKKYIDTDTDSSCIITLNDPGSHIDLGAIAKGYCADKITSLLKEKDVTSAMINLGGNICVIGSKPDGSPFTIGIEKPYSNRQDISARTDISNGTIVTCGIYERFFEKDGIKYHHILDPDTGYPVDTDLLSVSVRSGPGHSADCDALSTVCLLLGYEKASELIEKKDGFDALFILKDNSIKTTSHFFPDQK
ncbi:MAG: FAD:protein FMN transferase [Lachnospiraceae bacterium]|nr:FAD:protein FMN transferase [Lachnospiraceae bacterium]